MFFIKRTKTKQSYSCIIENRSKINSIPRSRSLSSLLRQSSASSPTFSWCVAILITHVHMSKTSIIPRITIIKYRNPTENKLDLSLSVSVVSPQAVELEARLLLVVRARHTHNTCSTKQSGEADIHIYIYIYIHIYDIYRVSPISDLSLLSV